jgi:hypothetical protein
MKNTTLNIDNITMSKASGYGHFIINGCVNGEWVKCNTTNSEAYDYLHNEEENEEMALEAQQYCEMRLEGAYEFLMSNLEGIENA